METYSMRTSDGTLIMTLVGKPATDIFQKIEGEWDIYQTKGKKRTVAYTITRDAVWGHGDRTGAFKIYLWAGTKIIKD